MILLDYAELISNELRRELIHLDLSHIPAPWKKLEEFESKRDKLLNHLDDFIEAKNHIQNFDGSVLEKVCKNKKKISFQINELFFF